MQPDSFSLAIQARRREPAREQLDRLARGLQAHGIELIPLDKSQAPAGASAELRLAARCYDDAFWMIEELRPAESLARSAKGLALLGELPPAPQVMHLQASRGEEQGSARIILGGELRPNAHGFVDAGYGPRYMLPVWLPTNSNAAAPFGPGLAC